MTNVHYLHIAHQLTKSVNLQLVSSGSKNSVGVSTRILNTSFVVLYNGVATPFAETTEMVISTFTLLPESVVHLHEYCPGLGIRFSRSVGLQLSVNCKPAASLLGSQTHNHACYIYII